MEIHGVGKEIARTLKEEWRKIICTRKGQEV